MALHEYEMMNDYFQAGGKYNGALEFPCEVCINNEHGETNMPCKICGHNENAVDTWMCSLCEENQVGDANKSRTIAPGTRASLGHICLSCYSTILEWAMVQILKKNKIELSTPSDDNLNVTIVPFKTAKTMSEEKGG